ncbi:hypothetical protein [Salinimicrobium oceani]|uniref:Uncharacterized protein n=1 Tax=Salinimicrobium oceani TaxID=2722702 RepID=A0ABX1CVF8_9FLAO|nr:hypothetical protein [Salinimicrobium oceani]NJW52257.1 hypothetical protein [Salinimicrobium oceani]
MLAFIKLQKLSKEESLKEIVFAASFLVSNNVLFNVQLFIEEAVCKSIFVKLN